MAKPDKSKWPWNNRPSSRHVMKVTFLGETCQRCGTHYNTRVGGTAAVYCYPTSEWMAAHPTDDGLLGERRTLPREQADLWPQHAAPRQPGMAYRRV